MSGSVTGPPVGLIGGTPYTDAPESFAVRVSHVVAVSGEANRLGYVEQWQNATSGAMEDKPGGRVSNGTRAWAVGLAGVAYAVGQRLTLRRHSKNADRFEIVTTGGGSGRIPVRQTGATPTAANTYTTAVVQKFGTALPGAVPPLVDDAETVVFVPKSSGQLQRVGTVWWCEDTGQLNGDTPPKRKLVGVVPPEVKRRVQVGCDAGTGLQLYADVWVPDVN